MTLKFRCKKNKFMNNPWIYIKSHDIKTHCILVLVLLHYILTEYCTIVLLHHLRLLVLHYNKWKTKAFFFWEKNYVKSKFVNSNSNVKSYVKLGEKICQKPWPHCPEAYCTLVLISLHLICNWLHPCISLIPPELQLTAPWSYCIIFGSVLH